MKYTQKLIKLMASIRQNLLKINQSVQLTDILPCFLILLLYTLLFQISLPTPLANLLSNQYPYTLLFGFLALSISFRLPYRFEKWISFALVLILFAIPLICLWNTGYSVFGRVGGLIPGSDAGVYLKISESLLDGQRFGLGWKRPLFPGFLAFLLWLTQRNILIVQALTTSLTAISCFLLSRELKHTFGNLVAIVGLIGTFSFYAPFAGDLLSEPLGLILGTLSFAVLLRGGTYQKEGLVLSGIGLLAAALCARMGAVPILLFLIIWGGVLFRKNRLFSWPFAIKALVIIISIFYLNSRLSNYISQGIYVSFGNYAHTLYGLLTGTTWMRIYTDHPDITKFPKDEQIARIYQYCLEIIARDPMALIRGVTKSFSVLIGEGSLTLLSTGTGGIVSREVVANLLIRPLLMIGLIGCIWRSRSFLKSNPKTSTIASTLLLIFVLGNFLSAPFLPLWDTGWRPYICTIPSIYVLLGLGMAYVTAAIARIVGASFKQRAHHSAQPPIEASNRRTTASLRVKPQLKSGFRSARLPLALVLGILIAGVAFVWPWYLKSTTPRWFKSGRNCPPALEKMELYINPASVLYLHPDAELKQSRVPHLRLSDFQKDLTNLGEQESVLVPFFKDIASQMKENTALLPSNNGGASFITINSSILPKQAGHYVLCSNRKIFSNPDSPVPMSFSVLNVKRIHIKPLRKRV